VSTAGPNSRSELRKPPFAAETSMATRHVVRLYGRCGKQGQPVLSVILLACGNPARSSSRRPHRTCSSQR
jgi:hypothetical protein